MKEFTQASMKSKKDAMHGVEGQSELVSILIEYLTAEFKLKQSDNPAELPNAEVRKTLRELSLYAILIRRRRSSPLICLTRKRP